MPIAGLPSAAVFDLDGVVTFTARVHAAAWKELFDEYMQSRERRYDEPFREFDIDADYRAYVDGKPRYDGVKSFLESRGIHIPYGQTSDPPDRETVCGLANRKNAMFVKKVEEMGVEVDHDAVRFIRELRGAGVHVGLASSSKNAVDILKRVHLLDLFEAVVDGQVSEKLKLRGKPEPDIFITCNRLLLGDSANPAQSMVVEDAIAGVQAGRRGGFGVVLGVDRHGEADSLRENGADWVISDFRQVTVEKLAEHFRERSRVA